MQLNRISVGEVKMCVNISPYSLTWNVDPVQGELDMASRNVLLCVLLNDTEWPIQCERTCQTVGDRDRSIIGIGVGWLVFLKKLVLVSVCYSN